MRERYKETKINTWLSCMVGDGNYVKISVNPAQSIVRYTIGNLLSSGRWSVSTYERRAIKCIHHLEDLFSLRRHAEAEYEALNQILNELRRLKSINE